MKIKSVLIEFGFQTVVFYLTGVLFITRQILYSQCKNEFLETQTEDHINSGRFGEAIHLLNHLMSSNPQDPSGYNHGGVYYESRKDYEKAVWFWPSKAQLDKGYTLQHLASKHSRDYNI